MEVTQRRQFFEFGGRPQSDVDVSAKRDLQFTIGIIHHQSRPLLKLVDCPSTFIWVLMGDDMLQTNY